MDLSVLHINDLTPDEMRVYNQFRALISVRKVKGIAQKDVAARLNVDARLVHAFEKKYSQVTVGDFETNYEKVVTELLQEQKQGARDE